MVLVIWLVFLAGCVGDQKGRIDQTNTTPPPKVDVNVLPQKEQDLGEVRKGLADLRTDIATSSNNTANQFSGLLNANVSKLAERLTGLEANLSELVKITATMNNTANVDMKNQLDAALTAVTSLRADLKILASLDAKFDAKMTAHAEFLSKIELKLGNLENNMNANAQVGLSNSVKLNKVDETLTASAGRDVNMYPAAAVYTVLGTVGAFVIIFGVVGVIAVCMIINSYKASREREADRTKNEKDERMRYEKLLMKAISMIPEGKLNREISRELGLSDPKDTGV